MLFFDKINWRVKACFDMKKQAFSLHCATTCAMLMYDTLVIAKEPQKKLLTFLHEMQHIGASLMK
ncbi:MAG: hypothetical protein B6242_06625 [Anaerolineaceae bacterium 4572_78]|nr:MAG: hypothetical protein B6242_06625 [Anaerolineaceae bacterium 4572_78]